MTASTFVDLGPAECLLAQGKVADALSTPLVPERGLGECVENALFGMSSDDKTDTVWVAGLTLADLAYDFWRISPEVLDGADFARADDVQGLLGFPVFADHVLDLSGGQLQGTLSQLDGYVAEQVAAHQLQAMGHVVEFPHVPNQEGWDLLVDGRHFQIKCLDDPSGVYTHFERYPHIPVIVNEELASSLAGHHDVYTLPGFTHHGVVDLTQDSLHAGQDVLDFQIPWISLFVAGARNARGLITGQIDPASALLNVTTDVGGRTAAGVLGSKACAIIGGLLGPAGVVAGGAVGAILGSTQGQHIGKYIRRKLMSREEGSVRGAAAALVCRAHECVATKTEVLDQQASRVLDRLPENRPGAAVVRECIKHRFASDRTYLATKGLEMAKLPSDAQGSDAMRYAADATKLAVRAAVHPVYVQDEYGRLLAAVEALRRREKALRLS